MHLFAFRGESLLPYCGDRYLELCSPDGRQIMTCNVYKHEQDLPEEFQV